jgi:DNA-binding MarR family transcriptional regulator
VNLTASERIILHVAEYWRVTEAIPELTQKGIASGAGVQRSHVPRNLKRLISQGHLEAVEGRIGGRARRVNYYRITEAGLRQARDLRESLKREKVVHGGKALAVADVAAEFAISPLAVALRIDESGTFHPPVTALQEVPGLIEREDDIAQLRKWSRDRGPVMVVYGAAGVGKTALGRAFISQHSGPHAWLDLHEGADLKNTLTDMTAALGLAAMEREADKSIVAHIRSHDVILVLDGYNQVSEDLVDFLAAGIEDLKGGNGKLLVLAQETTPSYCRFYGRGEVSRGDVRELHLKGLSISGCKRLLGSEHIDEEALKRIFLLTKGTPLYIDLIRRGDADELRRRSRFTSAEIRLMMFSKSVSSRA